MIEIDPLNDTKRLRQAFGCFPSGVIAVCALIDGRPVGMAASSFTSVSLDPPLVAICVQDTPTTWPRLRSAERLGVSVLAEGHDVACRTLSLKVGDRFAEVQWRADDDSSVFVDGSAAWLTCSVHAEMPAGDHVIMVLAVHSVHLDPEAAPLVFHGSRFRRLAVSEAVAR
jgi:flavin reductase (DIM6/NTAB) family NADH-FMN oxidoreductase RutF